MATARPPVLFVHGLWLPAASWDPWIAYFAERGYVDAAAPAWPGEPASVEAARREPDRVAGVGIDDIVTACAVHIGQLATAPIVIGHSLGGLVAQRLLGQDLAAAAVAIDAAPIKGVLPLQFSALRVAWVGLRNPLNVKRAVSLDRDRFRYGFGNAVSEQESAELYERWSVPSPARPLFEAAIATVVPGSPAQVDTGNAARGPLLLVAGGMDHTVPAAITRSTLRLYRRSPARTDYLELPDRGHSLAIDSGWRQVADAALTWLSAL